MANHPSVWASALTHPLHLSPTLLIPIEEGKGRLWKQERMRRGAGEQAKGSTDIHGNLQIHSVVIISINAERQRQTRGGGKGVWESLGGGRGITGWQRVMTAEVGEAVRWREGFLF